MRVGGAQSRLDGFGALFANETADLAEELSLNGLAVETKTGNKDDDHEQWRNGKDGIIGEGGTETRGLVPGPIFERGFQEACDFLEAHHIE